ncbi:MAG: tRNA (guanine-N1)-methyltransferase [Archaeoglobaceae archaeon]
MRLKDLFVEKLRGFGIERIGTSCRTSLKDPIRSMVLQIMNSNAKVLIGDHGVKFSFSLDGKKLDSPPQAIVGYGENAILGKENFLDDFPYIAIDCRFYDLHTEKEKAKLKLQVTQTLGIVREFMWDEKLVIAGKDFGVGVYCERLEEFLKQEGIDEVVLLDPKGERVFDNKKAKCYVIGGVVDKSENRDLTSKIGEELESAGIKCDRRRIELRGDIVGVPDRINHIAEIVLKVVIDGLEVEEAIRDVQPVVVARWRLRKEIPKKSVRLRLKDKTIRVVAKSTFDELSWLNVQRKDFYEVCREQRIYVVSDSVMEEIRRLEWDEKKKFYVKNFSTSFENSSTSSSSPSK